MGINCVKRIRDEFPDDLSNEYASLSIVSAAAYAYWIEIKFILIKIRIFTWCLPSSIRPSSLLFVDK